MAHPELSTCPRFSHLNYFTQVRCMSNIHLLSIRGGVQVNQVLD